MSHAGLLMAGVVIGAMAFGFIIAAVVYGHWSGWLIPVSYIILMGFIIALARELRKDTHAN